MRVVSVLLLAALSVGAAGCVTRSSVQCIDESSCNLAAGGACVSTTSGNQWCAYPDALCPGGLRFSDYDIGEGLAGTCVADQDPDAGVGADAEPGDAPNPVGWALAVRGQQTEYVTDLTSDSAGHLYITGGYSGSAALGSMVLESNGDADCFVAKVSPSGTVEWFKKFGGTLYDEGLKVAADSQGVTIAGSFRGTVNFGNGARTAAGQDVFVLRLNPQGQFLWVVTGGGAGQDLVGALAGDGTGAVYVGGSFQTSATFGGAALAVTGNGGWLAHYSSTGAHIWSKAINSPTAEVVQGMAVLGSDLLVVGLFADQLDLGGAQVTSIGGTDVFAARFAGSSGMPVWSQRQGGSGNDSAGAVTATRAGGAVVTGFFRDVASFGGAVLSSAGADDIFVWKLTGDGDHVWSSAFGGVGVEGGTGVLETAGGDVIVSGGYRDAFAIGGTLLPTLGNGDAMLVGLTPDGAPRFASGHGGGFADGFAGVALVDGDLVAAGAFEGTVNILGRSLTNMSGAGEADAFIIRE